MSAHAHDPLPEVSVSLDRPVDAQVRDLQATYPPGTDVIVNPLDTSYRFRCRVHSTDIPVIFDTFVGLYHVPPIPLPDRPVIVDLGANIGCTMVHYAALYPGARIVGIELDADNARLAQLNTETIPNATLIHAAIWAQDGAVAYAGGEAWGYKVEAGGGRQVEALSMPTLLSRAGISTVDFLKVDIEGGERELFENPGPWLDQVRSVAIEVHDDAPLIDRLIALLRGRGFQALRDSHHWSAVIAARPPS